MTGPPQSVAYCHCSDCRRWTGAPVGAFVAVAPAQLRVSPPLGAPFSAVPGVDRWRCDRCGSPIAARFDYLPDQIYLPIGVMDQADALPPALHCHSASQLSWLHLTDGLPRNDGSGRDMLNDPMP
ncbi:MAG: GFA family protein [Marinibacterium sp.]|nr:GFA family protein [Marinibacterium sp.]